MISIRKIIFGFYTFLLFVSFGLASTATSVTPEQAKISPDDFIEKFCKNIGLDEKVKLTGNKLELYSNPGVTKTALYSGLSLLMLASGALWTLERDQADRIRSIPMFIISTIAGFIAGKRIKYHLTSTPTFILDENGFTIAGSTVIPWNTLGKIELIQSNREIQLRDIFGKEVAHIADGDIGLPISTDALTIVINYYWNKYKYNNQ
ncbi:MAG: hypothetical protein WCT20_05100 [Candidatus Babeliales bacterium]|jgi:hypothetical protein